MNVKALRRQRIKYTVRKKISGTAQRPRLCIYRSNTEIYAQLIDDLGAVTLASASSRDKDIAAQKEPNLKSPNSLEKPSPRRRLHWDCQSAYSIAVDFCITEG